MPRVYNFGAGPATIAEEILVQAQQDFCDWQGTGMSIMEISHRSPEFQEMLQSVETDFRVLLSIPDNYEVLFLAAPARSQFAMVPMNLLNQTGTADYIITGIWSKMAADEGQRFGSVNIVASSEAENYSTITERDSWQLTKGATYFHYCANETIGGVAFTDFPELNGDVPLVCDMTSCLLSGPLDINRFGLIYAGAQKNMGIAGFTIVIVRKDLLGKAQAITPTIYNYQVLADNHSLYYTPASFACYISGLMFRWIKDQGGLLEMAKRNQRKSEKLYAYIDGSDFYHNPIDVNYRSMMNVPFILAQPSLDQTFLQQAKSAGLVALKGHRLVGGMRASLYNSMPESGVDALIDFMQDFAKCQA